MKILAFGKTCICYFDLDIFSILANTHKIDGGNIPGRCRKNNSSIEIYENLLGQKPYFIYKYRCKILIRVQSNTISINQLEFIQECKSISI